MASVNSEQLDQLVAAVLGGMMRKVRLLPPPAL
jgi:hypothetical protein